MKDGHQNTRQWSFPHPAQCLWVWIIQFVSTKAAFVIAGMCSQGPYPGCCALDSLSHHIQCRFQEISPHTGDDISQRLLKNVTSLCSVKGISLNTFIVCVHSLLVGFQNIQVRSGWKTHFYLIAVLHLTATFLKKNPNIYIYIYVQYIWISQI